MNGNEGRWNPTGLIDDSVNNKIIFRPPFQRNSIQLNARGREAKDISSDYFIPASVLYQEQTLKKLE